MAQECLVCVIHVIHACALVVGVLSCLSSSLCPSFSTSSHCSSSGPSRCPTQRSTRGPCQTPCAIPAWGAWSHPTTSHPSHFATSTRKGPDHPGARVAVKRQELLGVSSQGAKDLPQGLAERTFASSDRTRRWTCLLQVTAQAREEEHKTPQQKQAPPDMQTGPSIRACLRRGQPQRRQLRRVATTELRRDCSPEAEAGESRQDNECPRLTIAFTLR